jgi:hypothetical protein
MATQGEVVFPLPISICKIDILGSYESTITVTVSSYCVKLCKTLSWKNMEDFVYSLKSVDI